MIDYRAYPILFVDDEPDIVETLKLSHEREFTVLGATSGDEALAMLAREPVAVLVSDQRMPGMCGLELIARAREISPDLVAMIVTGYMEVDALVEAVERREIHRYVMKPWEGRELRVTLRIAIEKAHLLRENGRLARENEQLSARLRRLTEGATA